MNTSTQDLKKDAQTLLHDKGWKGPLTVGIIAILLGIVLNSVLFDLLKALIIFILYVGGIGLIGLAGYRAYQQNEAKK